MKKFICLIVAIMMILSAFTVVYATEVPTNTATGSEYDSIINYASLSKADMRNLGYSEKEITDINNYKEEFAKNIIKYSQTSSEELKQQGFSDIQISEFQKINRSKSNSAFNIDNNPEKVNTFIKENVTRGITGSITMSVTKYSAVAGKNTFKAAWYWTGRPIIVGFSESIGIGWTNGHTLTSYDNLKVTLTASKYPYPTSGGTLNVANSDKNTDIPDQAARFKFATAAPGGWLYDQGTAYLTLSNDDKKPNTTMCWKYAHGTVQIFGFGVNITGGSLSVGIGSDQMANGLKEFTGLL